MFEYPKTLITEKVQQSFNFDEFFFSWKEGGFVVKLVADKVIRQHMFIFTLTYFLDNNI